MKAGDIKKRAKLALVGKYWWSILARLILCFVGSGFVFNSFITKVFRGGKGNYEGLQKFIDSKISNLPIENMVPVATVVLIAIVVVILLLLFVVAIAVVLSLVHSSVKVGYSKFFMALFTDEDKPSFDYLFNYIRGSMWRCLWLDILTGLKVFLWFLPSLGFAFGAWYFFFIKPCSFIYQDYDVCYLSIICAFFAVLFVLLSIVASIRYSQARYVLADNPEELTASEAIEESKRIMKGNKWKYFWLLLSFLGWFILSVLTCGLGFFFLSPYFEATLAAFYLDKTENLEAIDLDSEDRIDA